jgi:hypothetical protein
MSRVEMTEDVRLHLQHLVGTNPFEQTELIRLGWLQIPKQEFRSGGNNNNDDDDDDDNNNNNNNNKVMMMMMMMMMMMIIIIINELLEPFQNYSQNTWAAYRESTTSMNYSKQLYWAQHTYCGKC